MRQKQIVDLANDIRKYFNCGAWTYFCRSNIQKPYLALIRALLKEMNYKMTSSYVVDTISKHINNKIITITKIS